MQVVHQMSVILCSGYAAPCFILILMPSSHCRHGQDMTALSCLVRDFSVNRIGDKSRLSATENFETVSSSLEMW